MLRTTTEWVGVDGAPYYTTLHFLGNTAGEATAAANATRTLWDNLDNILSSQLEAQVSEEVPQVDPATGQILQMFIVSTAPVTMAGPGELLPGNVQFLHRLRTGDFVNGRELRGRVFVPGVTENTNDNGGPSAAALAALQGAFDTFGGAAGPAGGWGVWSPTHGQVSFVTAHTPWNEFATLRSRRD